MQYIIAERNSETISKKKCECCLFLRVKAVRKATTKLQDIDKTSAVFGSYMLLCESHYQELVEAGEVLGA